MPTKIVVPTLGESVVEATVARWLKQEGDAVRAGEAVVELETDKVDLEVPAEKDGVLSKITRQAGEDVQIGDELGTIEEGGGRALPDQDGSAADTAKREPAAETESTAKPSAQPAEPVKEERATPVAKRIAAEKGIDLGEVFGAGPGGRVTKQDVQHFVQSQPTSQPTLPSPEQSTGDPRGETRERMSRRRRTIAERLVQAQQTAAMLTTFNEVDLGAVMELRKRRNPNFEKRHGTKVGFMSFFTKAVIGALKAFPLLNAEIQGDEIVLKHYYDIGIAVGGGGGVGRAGAP